MTDKELLELAAKAGGISGKYVENYNGDYYYRGETWGILTKDNNRNDCVWNPLTGYGDALRLAIELNIFFENRELFYRYYDEALLAGKGKRTATLYAIVRASAEIGKWMK